MIEIFLTVWFIILAIAELIKFANNNSNDHNAVGTLLGIIIRWIGIFSCLYFGGFYN